MAPKNQSSDEDLIAIAKTGGVAGRRAYGELVGRYQSRLVRLVRTLLGSSAHHEDVAQDALVRAFLALDRYPENAPFWPWIRTIATRLAFNHRRGRKTRKRYEEHAKESCATRQPVSERQALDHVLDQLSYPYREILILRHVEEMSLNEIAEELGIGSSAAKMRLSRARAEFREVYESATR